MVGLAERELGLGAARLDVVAGAGELRGQPAGAGGAAVSGERVLGEGRRAIAAAVLRLERTNCAARRGGNRGKRLAPRPGRGAARPAAALFFSYFYYP